MSLSMCPELLKIHIPIDINNLRVSGTLRTKLHASWTGFSVQNLLSDKIIIIPTDVTIPILSAIKLRKILQQPYHVFIYKSHNNVMTSLRPN